MLMLKSFLRFRFSTAKDSGFKVFVSNLDFNTKDEELRKHMSEGVGSVLSVNLFKDQLGRPKGFGLVEYSSKMEVQKAIETLNESVLLGRKIRIKENEEKSERVQRHGAQGAYGSGEKQDNIERAEKIESKDRGIPIENTSSNKVNGFKISLKNISFDVTDKEIIEKFSEFGKVIKASTYKNFDGRSTGKGYVIFETKNEAEKATTEMNKSMFCGRTLLVYFSNYE